MKLTDMSRWKTQCYHTWTCEEPEVEIGSKDHNGKRLSHQLQACYLLLASCVDGGKILTRNSQLVELHRVSTETLTANEISQDTRGQTCPPSTLAPTENRDPSQM